MRICQLKTVIPIIGFEIKQLLRADTGELEYQETEKAVEQIKSEIAAQVRNMRQADSNIRKYIQEDIEELSKELEKKEQILIRLRQEKNGDAHMTEEMCCIFKSGAPDSSIRGPKKMASVAQQFRKLTEM